MTEIKKRGHIFVVILACALVLLFVFLFGKSLTLDAKKMNSPLIGQRARDFKVQVLQGSESILGHHAESLSLSDLKGKPLILNFWASWCSTCAEEASIIEAFWKKHSSEGVRILAIAVHDRMEDVRFVTKSLGKSYPIAIDDEGKTALNYGVTGVPETIFINAQGLVIHKETGPVTRALLEEKAKLLASHGDNTSSPSM